MMKAYNASHAHAQLLCRRALDAEQLQCAVDFKPVMSSMTMSTVCAQCQKRSKRV